eukprot:3716983-Amphidinium_carterae.1
MQSLSQVAGYPAAQMAAVAAHTCASVYVDHTPMHDGITRAKVLRHNADHAVSSICPKMEPKKRINSIIALAVAEFVVVSTASCSSLTL